MYRGCGEPSAGPLPSECGGTEGFYKLAGRRDGFRGRFCVAVLGSLFDTDLHLQISGEVRLV